VSTTRESGLVYQQLLKKAASLPLARSMRRRAVQAVRWLAGAYVGWAPGRKRGVVSVVVPFYNVEKYLDDCLTSLRRQTYPWLELILVDDGSPDGSLRIAERHAAEDRRIRIIRKANGGLSDARNVGAEHARGEYLLFIDSDDTVAHTTVAESVASLRASHSDFAVFGYQRLQQSGTVAAAGEWIRRAHAKPQRRVSIEDRPDIQVNAVAWSKVYRRSFYSQSRLSFPVGRLYEDQPVSSRAYAMATAFDILPSVGVNWRIREDSSSISQQLTSVSNLTEQVDAGLDSVAIMDSLGKHTAARERAVQVLNINLMFYADALLVTDEAFYDAFRSCLERLWEASDPEHRARMLNMRTKIMCALMIDYSRSDVLEFLASPNAGVNSNPVIWIDGRAVLDMPIRKDPRYEFDPSIFVLSDAEMDFIGGVKSHRFADGRLYIAGWAYIAGVSPRSSDPAPEVWLTVGDRRVLFDVERVYDPAIDEYTKNRYTDYRHGGFIAVVDARELPRTGTTVVHVRVRSGAYVREGALYRRGQSEGGRTAWTSLGSGRFAYASAAGGRSLTVSADGGLRMARLEALRAAAAGDLTDVAVDGDELVLTVAVPDARSTSIRLEGPQAIALPVSVETTETTVCARFDLTAPAWGDEATPLPSGRYYPRLVRDGVPDSGDLWPKGEAVASAPFDQTTRFHRVRVRIRQEGPRSWPSVELSAPLTPDERGARNQQRLRDEAAVLRADDEAFFVRSLYGEVANCNPKGLQEALVRTAVDIPVYWSVVDHSVPIPPGGTRVIEKSAEWHRLFRTSRYLMVNVHQLAWYRKTDPEQVIIETFHGYPYKLMGHAWWTHASFPPAQIASFDERARDWTYVISPATYATELLDEAFVHPADSSARFLEIGYPRNDVLMRPAEAAPIRERVRSQLGIRDGDIAVLYAPTFRDYLSADDMTAEYVEFLEIDRLLEGLGEGYRLLMRGHPFNVRGGKSIEFDERVIDVSAYPDVNDLIIASDVAILDYSSLRFDYALTDKPMVFFVPDAEEYHRNRPGLLPYEQTAPGPHIVDTDAMITTLRDVSALQVDYAQARQHFREQYVDLDDGHAGERLLVELGMVRVADTGVSDDTTEDDAADRESE